MHRAGLFHGAALALLLLGAQAQAQPASGVLLSAEAGDVACYLRIRDDKGQAQSWMADFALCESATRFLRQRVALTWGATNVQHPSCQGDTDCRRTQRVTLITEMRRAK